MRAVQRILCHIKAEVLAKRRCENLRKMLFRRSALYHDPKPVLLPPALFIAADVRQLGRCRAQLFGRVILCDTAEAAAECKVGKIVFAEADICPGKPGFVLCLDPIIVRDRCAMHMERRVQIGCIAEAQNALQNPAVCAVPVNGS